MIFDCIIIGAGAAGLFCSATFPDKINGLILEKTSKPGTKLLMSGNGQCNITHSGSIKDFISHYGNNGKKIRGCLYKYNNVTLCDFLTGNGIPLFFRDDGKIFPKSMKAQDILNMLLSKSEKNGFRINYNSELTGIETSESCIKVFTENNTFMCKNLVLATGGFSYPSTGSDGSVFPILKRDLGIRLTDMRPALSPVSSNEFPYASLAGISFKNINCTLWRDGKKIYESIDDLLFTHRDFSGPLILNMAKEIRRGDTIKFNYVYPFNRQEVTKKIVDLTTGNHSEWKNIIPGAFNIPKSFVEEILKNTGNKPKLIAQRFTEDTFIVSKIANFKTAMATSGGVNLSEIDLKTMMLKKHPGIYVIGEMTDIDGHTGGYNLQYAFSSAKAANSSIL